MVLDNPKHERFAQFVATGVSASAAYAKVYKVNAKTAGNAGGRLCKNVAIQARIVELQQKSETAAVLTLCKKREILAQIVATPYKDITIEHPLCQGVTKAGLPIMPDKLRAMELDAKLAGELREKIEVEHSGGVEIIIGQA